MNVRFVLGSVVLFSLVAAQAQQPKPAIVGTPRRMGRRANLPSITAAPCGRVLTKTRRNLTR